MDRKPASRAVSTFADLPQLYATHAPAPDPENQHPLTIDMLDAEVADMREGEGSEITRADIAELFRESTAVDPFSASFHDGEGRRLWITDLSDEPGAGDMPNPFAEQFECAGIVNAICDLVLDTRMEKWGNDVLWGIVNNFHYVAGKIEKEADKLAAEIAESLRDIRPGEVATKELEDLQLRCEALTEERDEMEAMGDYAAAAYKVCTGRVWTPARGSRTSTRSASQIHAIDFLRARAEKRRDRHNPQGPIVVVSGPAEWHDYLLIWNRLDEILQRMPHMVVVHTGQDTGTDKAAVDWADTRGRPNVRFDLKGMGSSRRKGFRRNKQIHELEVAEAIICEGSGIQDDLYDLFNPQWGRRVPTHVFYKAEQCKLPPYRPSRRLGRAIR